MAEFTADVEREAASNFYRNLARCTRVFVEQNLKELLDLPLPEVQVPRRDEPRPPLRCSDGAGIPREAQRLSFFEVLLMLSLT